MTNSGILLLYYKYILFCSRVVMSCHVNGKFECVTSLWHLSLIIQIQRWMALQMIVSIHLLLVLRKIALLWQVYCLPWVSSSNHFTIHFFTDFTLVFTIPCLLKRYKKAAITFKSVWKWFNNTLRYLLKLLRLLLSLLLYYRLD